MSNDEIPPPPPTPPNPLLAGMFRPNPNLAFGEAHRGPSPHGPGTPIIHVPPRMMVPPVNDHNQTPTNDDGKAIAIYEGFSFKPMEPHAGETKTWSRCDKTRIEKSSSDLAKLVRNENQDVKKIYTGTKMEGQKKTQVERLLHQHNLIERQSPFEWILAMIRLDMATPTKARSMDVVIKRVPKVQARPSPVNHGQRRNSVISDTRMPLGMPPQGAPAYPRAPMNGAPMGQQHPMGGFRPGGHPGGQPAGHAGGHPGGHPGAHPGNQHGGHPAAYQGGHPTGGYPGHHGGHPGHQGGQPGGQQGGHLGGHPGGPHGRPQEIPGCVPLGGGFKEDKGGKEDKHKSDKKDKKDKKEKEMPKVHQHRETILPWSGNSEESESDSFGFSSDNEDPLYTPNSSVSGDPHLHRHRRSSNHGERKYSHKRENSHHRRDSTPPRTREHRRRSPAGYRNEDRDEDYVVIPNKSSRKDKNRPSKQEYVQQPNDTLEEEQYQRRREERAHEERLHERHIGKLEGRLEALKVVQEHNAVRESREAREAREAARELRDAARDARRAREDNEREAREAESRETRDLARFDKYRGAGIDRRDDRRDDRREPMYPRRDRDRYRDDYRDREDDRYRGGDRYPRDDYRDVRESRYRNDRYEDRHRDDRHDGYRGDRYPSPPRHGGYNNRGYGGRR